MGGFDDHISITGDWMPPSPSVRSFFSSMMNDDAVAGCLGESGCEGRIASGNTDEKVATEVDIKPANALLDSKVSSRGNLVERMAARAGFNAPRLNTESMRPPDIPKNSDGQPPFVMTIPPGLSPTTLLESPVFLNNLQVLPSPTTGKFSFAPCGNGRSSALIKDEGHEKAFQDNSSFAFKTVAESGALSYFDSTNKVYNSNIGLQSFSGAVSIQNIDSVPVYAEKFRDNVALEPVYHSVGVADNSPPLDDPNEEVENQNSPDPSGGSPADDGYSWRKYGQKQVKGSEYPRSYYKCTHANCPVKKIVERSVEGHIMEIIYKGEHNHPKPLANRRPSIGSSNGLSDMNQLESELTTGVGANGDLVWSNMQKGSCEWNPDNIEAAAPMPQEYGTQNGTTAQFEMGDVMDGSSAFSNEDEEDEPAATHGTTMPLGYDGEPDESEAKRRRLETFAPELSGVTRAIREPRVVVQTTSEVDILDDGYRWRKYGQKVVKGNPNPRSYYKCTSPGCNVRKHVERASHDLKSVITTYEGKHNHDVPAARNSSHVNSNNSGGANHIHRPEPSARFGRSELGAFGVRPPQMSGLYGSGLANLAFSGVGPPNQGKLPPIMPPLHHHHHQHHNPYMGVGGMSLMVPKMEPKLEHSGGDDSSDNSSSMYQQLMSRLPLGPHPQM